MMEFENIKNHSIQLIADRKAMNKYLPNTVEKDKNPQKITNPETGKKVMKYPMTNNMETVNQPKWQSIN